MGSLTNGRESAALSLRRIIVGALICCVSPLALPNVASARERRSHAVTLEFQREHPCPLNTVGYTGETPASPSRLNSVRS
jgi:hypothetical protein